MTLISRMQGCVYMTGAERNMCATQVIAGHLQVMPTAVAKGQAWQPWPEKGLITKHSGPVPLGVKAGHATR